MAKKDITKRKKGEVIHDAKIEKEKKTSNDFMYILLFLLGLFILGLIIF